MKKILPSMREKKRYLVFEAIGGDQLDADKAFNAIQESCREFMGSSNLGKAGLSKINKWNPRKNRGIVRINNNQVNAVKAAINFITNIRDEKIIVKSVGTSGILKKAEAKFLS